MRAGCRSTRIGKASQTLGMVGPVGLFENNGDLAAAADACKLALELDGHNDNP